MLYKYVFTVLLAVIPFMTLISAPSNSVDTLDDISIIDKKGVPDDEDVTIKDQKHEINALQDLSNPGTLDNVLEYEKQSSTRDDEDLGIDSGSTNIFGSSHTSTSPDKLFKALTNNLFFSMSQWGNSLEGTIHNGDNLKWFISGIEHPFFNGVTYANIEPNDVMSTIDSTVSNFMCQQLPMCWWIGPDSNPKHLSLVIEQLGLQPALDVTGMYIDLTKWQAPQMDLEGINITQVLGLESLNLWVKTLLKGFEMPQSLEQPLFDLMSQWNLDGPVRCYLTFLNDKPVATSMLVMDGNTAGIYWVCTVPEAREHGCGTAATIQAVTDAANAGQNLVILQSTEAGYSIYKNIGFEDFCKMKIFVKEP